MPGNTEGTYEYQVAVYEDMRCVARISRPVLCDEERQERVEEVRNALAQYIAEREM